MHHQDSALATSLDLLTMLAAGLRAGLPQPLGMRVDSYSGVFIHANTSDDAAAWEQYWSSRGAYNWSDDARETGDFDHHHRIGTWRGATVDIVHLTPTDQPAEAVPA